MKGKLAIESMIDLLENKEILFIENDLDLDNSVGAFETFCIDNKLKYRTILDASNVPTESIITQVNYHDVIVWQSTYITDRSIELIKIAKSGKHIHPKILIECFINEPYWFYKPDGFIHRLFILDSFNDDVNEWEFNELKDDHKAIWNKEPNEL